MKVKYYLTWRHLQQSFDVWVSVFRCRWDHHSILTSAFLASFFLQSLISRIHSFRHRSLPMISLYVFAVVNFIVCESSLDRHECDPFLVHGDCYFYPCLDARYMCGPKNHLVGFSYDLCRLSTQLYRSRLTKNAQWYFSAANLCAMTKLKDQLVQLSTSRAFTCIDLQETVMNIHLDCLRNHSKVKQAEDRNVTFCSILSKNLDVIVDTFTNLNPVYTNLISLLKELIRPCGGQINGAIKYQIPTLLISIFQQRTDVQLTPARLAFLKRKKYRLRFGDWF